MAVVLLRTLPRPEDHSQVVYVARAVYAVRVDLLLARNLIPERVGLERKTPAKFGDFRGRVRQGNQFEQCPYRMPIEMILHKNALQCNPLSLVGGGYANI